MQKILIIGNNGSGKSVFAQKLGEKTKLPVIHLDKLYHNSGWQGTPQKEWDKVIEDLLQQESWIIDGLYRRTLKRRLQAADTIFFLDYPKWLTLYRIVKRRFTYHGRTRSDMPAHLKEKISFDLLKKMFTFPRTLILSQLQEVSSSKKIIIFDHPKKLKQYLATLS